MPTEPKARKSAGKRCGTTLSGAHRIFTRRRSLVRVQQSPPRENLGNLVFPRFFSFLMEFSMSACDGHFAVLCFPMLPCFRSQAVLSCTPFVPWEPYKYPPSTSIASSRVSSQKPFMFFSSIIFLLCFRLYLCGHRRAPAFE